MLSEEPCWSGGWPIRKDMSRNGFEQGRPAVLNSARR